MDFDKKSVLIAFKQSLETTSTSLVTNWEETNQIEFKKSLHTVSETISKNYLPTISGYANNIGGIILFGILPITKELVGIKDEYENLDNRYVSTTVRTALDGDINFEFFTERFLGKIIGFLVVKEAKSKPIILKADAGDSKLGEIYFRYPGLTSKIGAGELRQILLEEITSKAQRMIEAFQKIVDAGNENIAILNTKTGEIESTDNNLKLTLNENILNKLNLIKRGEIVSEEGAPAYVIKGEIEIESTQKVEKHIHLLFTEKEVIKAFLKDECEYPLKVIDYIMTLHTFYMPIHFFLKKASLTNNEGISYIKSINSYSAIDNTKTKIIERLNKLTIYSPSGKLFDNLTELIESDKSISDTVATIKKRIIKRRSDDDMQIIRKLFFNTLISNVPISINNYNDYLQRAIEAFSNLQKKHILNNPNYFKDELSKIIDLKIETSNMSILRKVICMIDVYLYGQSI